MVAVSVLKMDIKKCDKTALTKQQLVNLKLLIHYNTFTKRSISTEMPTEKVRPVVIAELQ